MHVSSSIDNICVDWQQKKKKTTQQVESRSLDRTTAAHMHLYILGSDPAGLAGGGKDRAYAATGPKYEQKYHPNSGLSILHTDMQPMRHDLSIFLTIYPFRARRSAKVVCPSRSINDAGELSVRYRCPSPPLFTFFFLFFLFIIA